MKHFLALGFAVVGSILIGACGGVVDLGHSDLPTDGGTADSGNVSVDSGSTADTGPCVSVLPGGTTYVGCPLGTTAGASCTGSRCSDGCDEYQCLDSGFDGVWVKGAPICGRAASCELPDLATCFTDPSSTKTVTAAYGGETPELVVTCKLGMEQAVVSVNAPASGYYNNGTFTRTTNEPIGDNYHADNCTLSVTISAVQTAGCSYMISGAFSCADVYGSTKPPQAHVKTKGTFKDVCGNP